MVSRNSGKSWEKKLSEITRKGEVLPPIASGLWHLPIPPPERLYVSFGERIPTQGLVATPEALWAIREQTAHAIEHQLAELQSFREQDSPQWHRWRRKLTGR